MAITEIDPGQEAGSRIVFDIHPDVIAEAADLITQDYGVRFDRTPDRFAYDLETQAEIDAEIADLEVRTLQAKADTGENPGLLQVGRSAFANWTPLTKRAIALHNIYDPLISTLGEGINPDVYDEPLFGLYDNDGTWQVMSARECLMLTQKTEEKAAKIAGMYENFIPTPIDEASRRIWQGARDGAGVRTRATCAMNFVTDHLETVDTSEGVVTASLACGAAGPVYELMKNLQEKGIPVKKAILADMDPMALASAKSLADKEGVTDKIELKLENLIGRDLTEIIEPGSVDVVDLLGLFEYFPPDAAADLLRQAQKIVKPGGMIVFGNMIDRRPQQTFFTEVSTWEPLQQRSLTEMFSIVDEAGLGAKENARILLPPQGVYAVVAVRIPEAADQAQAA